jgi:heme A synthase
VIAALSFGMLFVGIGAQMAHTARSSSPAQQQESAVRSAEYLGYLIMVLGIAGGALIAAVGE